MRIEAGKEYMRRNGSKCKVLSVVDGVAHTEQGSSVWGDTGRVWRNNNMESQGDLMSEVKTSPVRTVTRREIVPGTYGRIKVTGTYQGNRVTMDWDRSDVITEAVPIVGLSSEELREAAHLFNQLAEALEDKP